jgi:Ricin-type beta-trefoil lectin domain-like
VDQWSDLSGANNEHWNVMAVGDGTYRIVNVNSGLDLEDNGWGTGNGSVVDQWQDNGAGSTNEFWRHAERRRFLQNRERLQRSRSGRLWFPGRQ